MTSSTDHPPKRTAPPVTRREIVRSGLCIGCGGCVTETNGAYMRMDHYGQLVPAGPPAWLGERSAAFSRTCPFSPGARNEDEIAAARFPAAQRTDRRVGRFDAAYVGHVAELDFRAAGSSGGMVSWVAAELLREGLVDGVAHVVATPGDGVDRRFFRYRISRTAAAVCEGAKSRYYPVELSEVLATIRATPGRYAVVGIPCFIKAVHLLCAEDPVLRARIRYTLGLYCGHMKSARMVESFAWQLGTTAAAVGAVDFRLKDPERPANWYTAHLVLRDGTTRSKDWWHLADGDWGAGFFQNSACNFCDDVVAETADIAFGDAWVEPYSSDGRGTNVVIVRNPELHAMLRRAVGEGRLRLEEVDADFVAATQAAGFRQRREGLGYRLSWPRAGVTPRKRVAPRQDGLPLRRRLVYRMRYGISAWSHRVFWLARRTRLPSLYIGWARFVLAIYQGLAYSRGRWGRLADRLAPKDPDS